MRTRPPRRGLAARFSTSTSRSIPGVWLTTRIRHLGRKGVVRGAFSALVGCSPMALIMLVDPVLYNKSMLTAVMRTVLETSDWYVDIVPR
jgi:hypothetical protein